MDVDMDMDMDIVGDQAYNQLDITETANFNLHA